MERETGTPAQVSINVWDLYTDDGRYFFSRTKAGLPAQVKKDNNQGDGQFAREVAAATYAVKGNQATALVKMAWPNATPVPAWLRRRSRTCRPAGCRSTTTSGRTPRTRWSRVPATPRCGPACCAWCPTLPDITVTHGTVDGQPTLTLTAGAAELGHPGIDKADPKVETGPAYQEAITINADTGIPLGIASSPAGKVSVGTVTYVVTRVSLADIAAGKF